MAGPRSSEKYACDACRSSKVSCSREILRCSRCVEKELRCVYSRSGIIRRRTRRKRTTNCESLNTATPARDSDAEGSGDGIRSVESLLEDDVALTQQYLGGMSNTVPMDALSSLSNVSSRFTLDRRRNGSNMRAAGFHDMSDYSRVLVDAFDDAGGTSSSWLINAPFDVKTHFRFGQPHKVQQSAWLVMYYAALSNIPATQTLQDKIHGNLWHALSDARVLLEPSELNIRAVLMVVSEAVTTTTPTMCWMLASTACRMLSLLGLTATKSATKSTSAGSDQGWRSLFWHLNLMDKAFAIIFRKSPNFNRKMIREICPPTVQDFLNPIGAGHGRTGNHVGIFTAHYVHQKVQLSYLMHDIWTYLYDEDSPDESRLEALLGNFEVWHGEAQKVLEAASITERPFSNNVHIESMSNGRRALDFHYTYLTIMLTKNSREHHELFLRNSALLLNGLKELRCLPKDPYQPFLWQLLCCPFTPFLVLFRSIITFRSVDPTEDQDYLNVMRQLPEYLEQAKAITPLATKLQEVANVITQYAAAFLVRQETYVQQSTLGSLSTSEHHLNADTSLPTGCDGNFDFNESRRTLNTCTETLRCDDSGLFDWLDWEEEFDFLQFEHDTY